MRASGHPGLSQRVRVGPWERRVDVVTTPPPPRAREILERAGLRAKKSWGQNFLTDQHVLSDIAALTLAGPTCPVLEIGAGLGALTYHLLQRGAAVRAVERDREIVPLLKDALSWAQGLEVIEADAASLDYTQLRGAGERLVVAGNLPYQISSRLLVHLAEGIYDIERAVVMVQREVAQRAVARPGSRDFGVLSVLLQASFACRIGRLVPRSVFYPPPNVDSAVLVLSHAPTPWSGQRHFFRVVKGAFSQRRKMLRRSLSGGLGCAVQAVDGWLSQVNIDGTRRAETLSIEEFGRITETIERTSPEIFSEPV